MKQPTRRTNRRLAVFLLIFGSALLGPSDVGRAAGNVSSQTLVLSAQMENGALVYRLDGKRVEDSRRNSLLTNLIGIVKARGTDVPVFIIIDVRASFTEVGKLETALDKTGLTRRRLFVSNFKNGVMNEIRWDETAVPIPSK